MKVYNETTSKFKNIQPTAAEQVNIDKLSTGVDGTTNTSGTPGTANMALINTVSANTSNINTLASISANITTVAGISGNVTTVAGVHGNVTTVAGSIANVNLTGGSIANVNHTGGSIANVNTVASNISNVNNFAALYQIDDFSPSAPSTDGSGASLSDGDLAYDTTANRLKVYEGSAFTNIGFTLAETQLEANNAAVAMAIALG